MNRADLDKIIFYFKKMLSYKNYIKDDKKILNKVYLVLGKERNHDEDNSNTYKNFIDSVTKVTLDIIKVLGEEDRKYFLSHIPKFIKVSLLDDKRKLELLNGLNPIEQKVIIQSLKYKDEEKIALLDRFTNEPNKIEIIRSMDDDNKKIELLKDVESEKNKASIIESLQNDEQKIGLLGICKHEANRTRIIVSLRSDDEKNKLLKSIENETNKIRIIKSLKDDDKKVELLKIVKKSKNKVDVIISIENDDKKIEILEKIENIIDKINIIKSLQNDDKKIELLDENMDEFSRKCIIETIQDDDKKIRVLKTLNNESDICEVIKEMQVDDKKIEALKYLQNLNFKLAVIRTLNDDIKKDRELSKIDKEIDKVYQTISEFAHRQGIGSYKYKKINLPEQMTFGIEIESAGEYRGLLPIPVGKWKNETDDSIGKNGIEIVSPVMKDSPQFIYEIYKINEILQKMKMKITPNCGGHVHIGANYIKTEEGFRELIELWGNAEEIYYIISNKKGELPREYTTKYALPISKKFEEIDFKQEDSFIDNIKRIQKERRTSINFLNVNKRKSTIEFRLSNGTLDADTWIENIRLYGRTVQVAAELGEIVKKLKEGKELTNREKAKYKLKEMLKEELSQDEKMEILMEILFSEEEKEVYQERYRINRELERKEQILSELKFGKIDFKNECERTEEEKCI